MKGNETINNCEICIDNYKLLNDPSLALKNCYIKCESYYFINENNEYACTESDSCPQEYNYLIISKNKCVDDCKNDARNQYEYNNNCYSECPENKKTYKEEKLCLNECYSYQFEYNNICYNNCPSGTFKIYINRNICIETVPENYYLDNNDNIYKKCFNNCKKCTKEGNETNNNCEKCINNYIFLNDSLVPLQNCYQKCNGYYYFNSEKQYFCVDTCPEGYNKLIT